MARHCGTLRWLAVISTALTACNTAHADRLTSSPSPRRPLGTSPEKSPYQIELIGENGLSLVTYEHRRRFYTLGDAGDRYSIRVINPTGRRIEAVISVDGLDVIDGQAADVRKRGYVVPAHGELTVDGFRVSTREVATFRFSSVSNSYAGRKGVARNVGVIGVALFAEQSDPQLILADPARPADRRHDRRSPAHDRGYRGEMRSRDHRQHDGDGHSDFEVEAEQAPAAAGDSRTARGHSRAGSAPAVSSGADKIDSAPGSASTRLSRPGRASKAPDEASEDGYRWRRCCVKPKERPGLGTAFGERRGSTATWTRFVRANATVPTAIAELHYNDAAGLRAVGIPIGVIDDDEIATRESANPFPGSRFAEPPRR